MMLRTAKSASGADQVALPIVVRRLVLAAADLLESLVGRPTQCGTDDRLPTPWASACGAIVWACAWDVSPELPVPVDLGKEAANAEAFNDESCALQSPHADSSIGFRSARLSVAETAIKKTIAFSTSRRSSSAATGRS